MNYLRLMIWKEFAQIKADPLMLRLLVVPALLQLFIVGYALTTEVRNTPVAVLDRSQTPQSRELIAAVQNNALFDFKSDLANEAEARQRMDAGEVRVVIGVPPDFAQKLDAPEGTQMQLLVDGQDASSAQIAAGYLNAVVSGWVKARMEKQLMARGIRPEQLLPVTVSTRVLFNPMLKSSWYMIPALVVLLVTIVTALLSGFSIVKEKERGTFEQLMVTPISPLHVVLGKSAAYAIIGILEIAFFLVLATLWFGIPFRGFVPGLFLFGVLYMFSSLGIGILTSTLARTAQQVMFLIWFILIFFILLSGLFVPLDNMPGWVQTLSLLNPVRFFMYIVREMSLKGAGMMEFRREALILLLLGVGVYSVALLTFKRRLG
ncbi:MAG: ABC transporter permease [Fibrobacterota bacterium]